MKKFLLILTIFLMMLVFSSCETPSFQFNPENLMRPPTTTPEQESIEKALTKSISDAKLKYPKSGEYRSAFILKNIDDDEDDEAIVFFTSAKTGNKVRIAILDKIDGEWSLIAHREGLGEEVDKICFAKLSDSTINILVGYSGKSMENNKLVVYTYEDSSFFNIYECDYKQFVTINVNDSKYDSIITLYNTITFTKDGSRNISKASLIKNVSGKLFNVNEEVLSINDATNTSFYVEKRKDNTNYIYLDHKEVYMFTEVLILKESEIYKIINDDWRYTGRSIDIPVTDFDNDGIIEIPSQPSNMPVEIISDRFSSSFISYVYWQEAAFNRYVPKLRTIYNKPGNYFFVIPDDWLDFIQVESAREGREMIVSTKRNNVNEPTELIRILANPNNVSNTKVVPPDYDLFNSTDEFDYYIKINEKATQVAYYLSDKSSFTLINNLTYDSIEAFFIANMK